MTAVQHGTVTEMGPTSAHGTRTWHRRRLWRPAFKFEVTDTAKLNVRVGAVVVRWHCFTEGFKHRLCAPRYEYCDSLLLNFQLRMGYRDPAWPIVIVIIVNTVALSPWRLITLSLSRNPASVADPETTLPRLLQPINGQINPSYTSSLWLL